jgi:hypothetical protein
MWKTNLWKKIRFFFPCGFLWMGCGFPVDGFFSDISGENKVFHNSAAPTTTTILNSLSFLY